MSVEFYTPGNTHIGGGLRLPAAEALGGAGKALARLVFGSTFTGRAAR